MQNMSATNFNKFTKILVFVGFLFVSISLIGLSFLAKGWIQNLLLSIGANLFCSGFFYFVLAMTIEKSEIFKGIEREKKEEKDSINRFVHQITAFLEKTRIQFNELTGDKPINGAKHDGFNEVSVNGLKNLFMPSAYIFSSLGTSVLEAYLVSYKGFVTLCEKMLFSINFKYFLELKGLLEKISLESVFPSCAETLINFRRGGNSNLINTIVSFINDYSDNPEEDLKTNKYSGNIFLNVIQLYLHLKNNRPLFIGLREELLKITTNENYFE